MALWDRFRSSATLLKEPTPEYDITMEEALERYDLVDVQPTHVVMTERMPLQLAQGRRPTAVQRDVSQQPDMTELGSTGTSAYGYYRHEYVPELRGLQGLRMYDKMKRGDARVRSSLRLLKTPVLAGRWYVEPASTSTRDINCAKFIEENLFKWMTISWPQFLSESMLMLDYGYYMFEKVFTTDDQGRVIWQKFAPRHPMDVINWHFDSHGGPDGAIMQNPNGFDDIPIPIEKLIVFSYDKEAGNIEGLSVLRSAYKHWFYKDNLYKIDAIQKERHGIGIPIIKLPPGFSPTDKNLADEMGRNLRTNEKAHIVLPPNWEVMFADLRSNLVDALASAVHHDSMISANILSEFIASSTSGGDAQDLFVKGARYVADQIRDVFNKHAIPQLVDYNYSKVGYPELRVRRVGETTDWRTISFALRNLASSGILQPDDRLEDWIRDEMDLPLRDESTLRIIPDALQAKAIPVGDVGQGGETNPVGLAPGDPGYVAAAAQAIAAAKAAGVGAKASQGVTRQANAGSTKPVASKQTGKDGSGG